jgi:hypothetical protein
MANRKTGSIEFFQVADGWRLDGLQLGHVPIQHGHRPDDRPCPYVAVRTDVPVNIDGDYT